MSNPSNLHVSRYSSFENTNGNNGGSHQNYSNSAHATIIEVEAVPVSAATTTQVENGDSELSAIVAATVLQVEQVYPSPPDTSYGYTMESSQQNDNSLCPVIDGFSFSSENKTNGTFCLKLYIACLFLAIMVTTAALIKSVIALILDPDLQDFAVRWLGCLFYPILLLLMGFLFVIMTCYCRRNPELYAEETPRIRQCSGDLPSWQAWLQCLIPWYIVALVVMLTLNMIWNIDVQSDYGNFLFLQWGVWAVFAFVFCMPLCCYSRDCIHRLPIQQL